MNKVILITENTNVVRCEKGARFSQLTVRALGALFALLCRQAGKGAAAQAMQHIMNNAKDENKALEVDAAKSEMRSLSPEELDDINQIKLPLGTPVQTETGAVTSEGIPLPTYLAAKRPAAKRPAGIKKRIAAKKEAK